ncbi:hypothetical protein P280DRAFT_474415 [Massarina eburnea CBS 473.64]|uniref:DNA replication factor Cdt1 C-terminal domain-containing protein n=1 Tax=Massarina eburnea CBS 473.64 TaxID=1395130 RepID=A0A6A6RL26_9PLEO|nr:hypothetical protein P280DRAFT_474415 [Massarina eburnea CBS 473.64]
MSPIDASASGALPTELLNLLHLHSSFLTALSLHYAHNGTATPVDLLPLTESVSKVWRLRKVTYDDIRLCIGVLEAGPASNMNPFHLSDYGRGKICLEIKDEHSQNLVGVGGLSLTEDELKDMFVKSLDALWAEWSASTSSGMVTARPVATPRKRGRGRPKKLDVKQPSIQPFVSEHGPSIPKFVAQLPLAEITTCSSLTALAPLQEKGRKRLREFKDSVQQGRSAKKARDVGKENAGPSIKTESADPQTKMTDFASVRKTALLDRILAKQNLAASAPKTSPAELARQSALQRSEEVLGVLALLCASKGPSQPRVSFSMNALVQALQGSIRMQISKDEALRCVEVLAAEVAPGYVTVMRMGAMVHVVVNQALRPVNVRGRLVELGVAF